MEIRLKWLLTVVVILFCLLFYSNTYAGEDFPQSSESFRHEGFSQQNKIDDIKVGSDYSPGDEEGIYVIPDPFEPINRGFYIFNDKLYFWVLKPVSTGYKKVVPESIRVNVRNFFYNLCMPIRAVNCLLQGKIDGFGIEIGRFFVNTTAGMLGLGDPAKMVFAGPKYDEDFGQTLAFYGLDFGFFIMWPVLGPSSLRDTIGLAGDMFLDPVNYYVKDLTNETAVNLIVRSYDRVNSTSLVLGEYESLKRAALDPYAAVRDAYVQYRQSKIRE